MKITGQEADPKITSYSSSKELLSLGVIALVYFIVNKLSYLFAGSSNILIWPASSIAVAAFLLNPKNFWPKILTIIFIINLIVKLSLRNSFISMFGLVIVDTRL